MLLSMHPPRPPPTGGGEVRPLVGTEPADDSNTLCHIALYEEDIKSLSHNGDPTCSSLIKYLSYRLALGK